MSPTPAPTPSLAGSQSPLIGRVLGDRYRVLKRLGEGASGAVYLAEHVVLLRRVAIKLMRAVHSADPELLSRFKREARAASAVRHPGVIEVTDFGETPARIPYIVMEWVDGQTLAARIDRDGPLSVPEACRLLGEVAAAAVAAHAQGVVHRDLKPENLLITPDGHTKVGDFGLCAWGDADVSRLTLDGQVFGTPFYMAPEQVEGRPTTEQVDVYALGCILFETLTGRTVFAHRSPVAVLHAHVHDPPPHVADIAEQYIPIDLDALVASCLAKRAEDRPSMAEVRASLEAHSRLNRLDFVTPITDQRLYVHRGPLAWLRGSRGLAALTGAALGLMLAGVWGTTCAHLGVQQSAAQPEVSERVAVVHTSVTPPETPEARAEAEPGPATDDEGTPISIDLPVELVTPEPLVLASEAAEAAPPRAASRAPAARLRPTTAEGPQPEPPPSTTPPETPLNAAAQSGVLPSDLKPF